MNIFVVPIRDWSCRERYEEVVVGYGRRLKIGAKAFEDAWRKYRLLDLENDRQQFQKPDGKYAMKALRMKLMKPTDGVRPIYVPDIRGDSIQEAFMRGVHRKRPANDEGEELRDVLLWLWTLAYCDTADAEVAFISDDGGFWTDETVHPDIENDLRTKNGKLHVYRSIQDFLKAHAPTPVDVTEEWVKQHFEFQRVERELIDRAANELSRLKDVITDLSIKEHKVSKGKVYQISEDSQFAELELQLVFEFLRTPSPRPPLYAALQSVFEPVLFGGTPETSQLPANVSYLSNVNSLLSQKQSPQARAGGPAKISVQWGRATFSTHQNS